MGEEGGSFSFPLCNCELTPPTYYDYQVNLKPSRSFILPQGALFYLKELYFTSRSFILPQGALFYLKELYFTSR